MTKESVDLDALERLKLPHYWLHERMGDGENIIASVRDAEEGE